MVKFIQCSTGESSLTYTKDASGGTVKGFCKESADRHLKLMIEHLKYENFNNPYLPSFQAASRNTRKKPGYGQTHISCTGDTCQLYTYTGEEILSAVVKKE